jgi:FtsP/CotA-like multicopper oxidase with cupredoxin domain
VTRGQRIGLIGAALVVAALAVLLFSGGDDDDSEPASSTVPGTLEGEPTASVPAPEPKPEFEQIRIVDGAVPGGEPKITVSKGDVARFEVRSDAPDDIHLHGYDITKPVAPGQPARFRVDADIEGVFEIEAHDLGHVVVGTLVVEP